MHTIDDLLNMVATEAFENGERKREPSPLPTLRYDLELIEEPDGTLRWVE